MSAHTRLGSFRPRRLGNAMQGRRRKLLVVAAVLRAILFVRRPPDFEQTCHGVSVGEDLTDVRRRLDATRANYRKIAPRENRRTRWVWRRLSTASCTVRTDASDRVAAKTLTHDLL
jgi:hypothetical protein